MLHENDVHVVGGKKHFYQNIFRRRKFFHYNVLPSFYQVGGSINVCMEGVMDEFLLKILCNFLYFKIENIKIDFRMAGRLFHKNGQK